MSETKTNSTGPSPFVGAIVGAIGCVWVAYSDTASADHYVILVAVTVLGITIALSTVLSNRPAWAVGLALVALAWSVAVYLAVLNDFDAPLVYDVIWRFYWFGGRLNDFQIVALPALLISGAILFALARFRADCARFIAPLLRLLSVAASVGTCALLAWAIPNKQPEPHRYIESLPSLGVVPAAEGEPTRTKKNIVQMMGSMGPNSTYDVFIYETPLANDLIVRRYCRVTSSLDDVEFCFLAVRKVGPISESDESAIYRDQPYGVVKKQPTVSAKASYVIRDDEAIGALIIDGPGPYALDRQTFSLRGVTIRDILSSTRGPRGWILAAAFGLFGVVILEIFRFRTRRRIARLTNAPTGVLDADGFLTLDNDDSPPIRIGLDTGILPGPVLVLFIDAPIASPSPYRDRGKLVLENLVILPGKRAEVLRRERWALQSPIDTLAIALLVLAATPLVTYWLG